MTTEAARTQANVLVVEDEEGVQKLVTVAQIPANLVQGRQCCFSIHLIERGKP